MKLYMAAASVPRSVQRLLAAIFFVVMAGAAWAQGVLPVPALDGRVIDQTGTLDAAARQSLDAKLAAFEQKKGSQIVVLMVPTTQPEDIASYANRVASTWKIGRKEVGDGVLVIVAKDDRKMRIEVARTLEGAVPDLTAARIIDEQMKPRFRDNDFAGGINAAVDQLVAVIGGEALPEVQRPSAQRSGLGGGGFDWPELGIFLFFGVFVVGRVARSIFGNKLGPVVTGLGAGAIAMVVTSSILLAVAAGFIALLFTLFSGAMSLPSMGSGGRRGGGWGGAAGGALGGGLGGGFGGGFGGGSSGGGSSGGGGGFSSGGGGSFGGGGASGDW